MVRRCVDTAIMVLMVALAACSKERGTYRGVVVLDRSTARPIVATWATSKATESIDPADPLCYLINPTDVAIGPGDTIYVADMGSGRIVIYTPEGIPARTIGRRGQGPGEFEALMTIAVDQEGRIWAGEMGRLQVISASGKCLATTTDVHFWPLELALHVLPDGRAWTGGMAQQTRRLVRNGEGWDIAPAEPVVHIRPEGYRMKGGGRSLHPRDLAAQIIPFPNGQYACFFPLISGRKQYAWLHHYDARGVLLKEYDLDPAFVDSMYTIDRRGLDPAREVYLTVLQKAGGLSPASVLLLSSRSPFLCRMDLDRGTLGEMREVLVRSEAGTPGPLLVAASMAVDSRGQVVVVGMNNSQEWIVAKLPLEGGDAS